MQTIFDTVTCAEIVRRVDMLRPDSARQWGKMSPSQMLEHAARALETATGRSKSEQMWLGKVIGWTVRKGFLSEKPFVKNAPTAPHLVIKDEPAFEPTRIRLKELVRELHAMGERGCDGNVHAFFGPMSGAEWGISQYKHLDHHLRQFGL